MIWWDKNADEGELRSTLKLMGLSWEEFDQSRAKFKSKKRKKALVNLALVFLLCALTLIFVIKDK
ncbi:hypothetical protein [Campylobacter sp. VTCC 70190]|uniref:hypothetical protein n=1 Tax=Campylobacter sp. VTCC 70190 TaxID=3392118 RepID=UPI00398F5A66